MEHKHQDSIFTALEPLLHGIREIERVLGPASVPVIQRVQQRLIEAMAARDRGHQDAVFDHVSAAMRDLTGLAAIVDPHEAIVMKAIADGFQRALRRGDQATAKQQAALMMERSGAVERKKPS